MKIFKFTLVFFIVLALLAAVLLHQVLRMPFVDELDFNGTKITIRRG